MITRSYLKENQPIFYQILTHSFQSKKIPHAFLIVGQNSSEAAHFIAKSLICQNDDLACCECHDCQKIDYHQYSDMIYADGKESTIKKGIIEHIQDQLSKSSIEGKAKIYLLENIEQSTSEAMNSLLKILEEPTRDVYAIFTCQNLNRVLPTIQSRCQIVQLLPDSKLALKEQLRNDQLIEGDINILSELFHTYDECKEFIDTEYFDKLKLEVYYFIEDLYLKRDNLMIDVQTHLLKDYKEKKDIQLFLNMLVLGLRDLFHVKHNLDLTYPSYKNLYMKIQDTEENIIKKIELVLNTEYLLETNVNMLLLIDSMIYKI